jgi:lysophospholipase L1-like esterase
MSTYSEPVEEWSTAFLAALADPGSTLPFLPQPRSFANQTVRQAVRLRRGGGAVRLGLSNEFGTVPLRIDEVTIGGAPALLDGSRAWKIPPGAAAVGDPVALPVAAGDEVVVSCRVVAETGPATYLHSAQRAAEISSADRDAERTGSLYWIDRVLVDTPATGPVVVALGDSITRGDATTPDRDQRYPDHLQRRLDAAGLAGLEGVAGAVVLNAGIGANRLLRPGVGPAMVDRFDRDVLGVPEATHVVLLAGANDLGGQSRPSAEELVDGLFGLAQRAERAGVRPILATITPFGGSVYPAFVAPGNEELRRAVNRTLLGQRDRAVLDFAAALADPADPTRLAAAFDSGDGVHPSDAGAAALAAAVDLDLLAATGVPR